MSHTNHTQYYELPQYVGSDIINPLVDTNGAYETIDTVMHNIAAEAAQDTADVATLQSKVGSGVFDTTAQNATDAVNEVVGELNTADTGVKARLTTAENDIDTLQSQMVTAQGNITDLQNNKASASDVSTLQSQMSTAQGNISALQTTVGDANSGLVKTVNELNTTDAPTFTLEENVPEYEQMYHNLSRHGKIVVAQIGIKVISNSNTNIKIASILPRPVSPVTMWCPPVNNQTGGAIDINITTTGDIQCRYGADNEVYQATMVYITA